MCCRTSNSVPETFYPQMIINKLNSLAKCNMGIQREKTQKMVNLQGCFIFFTGLRILARPVAGSCLVLFVVLWPISQTELLLEEDLVISFESSLSHFLFIVLGPLSKSWDRFLFSSNFPENLHSNLVMSDISCATRK